ncbi:MAG TPA: YceI family protein [Gammaproteobacteria bacterium]|nr:YceI family protein [Gammaproteobacteria bacterium]
MLGIACGAIAAGTLAAPVVYEIDANHTYPSFEADHMGGLSFWRGKVNTSSGKVSLDKQAGTGTVDITIDMKSIDFGHQGLNDHAQTPDLFDTAKFPTATYTGKLVDFRNGSPTAVDGTLTLHGVTKPLRLTINSFLCKPDQRAMKERCGADAQATFNRDEFGVDFGKAFGFTMGVTLRIQVEALAAS